MSNLLAEDLDHILDHTRDLWEELRGQRIFITGGTGFFGCWLLESFAWANRELSLGASALVLTRNPAAIRSAVPHVFESPAIQICHGDVRTFAPSEGEFTHVVHAASAGSADPDQDPLDIFRSTVCGTTRVMEAAAKWRTKKILFTSSGAIYGPQPSDLFGLPEDFHGAPDPAASSSAVRTTRAASIQSH